MISAAIRALMRFVQLAAQAYASWSAALGVTLGIIALTNLIVRTLHLSLTELLALTLDAYQKTFHPPIAFLFSWLPFPLPAGVKDGIVVYIAMAGVLYRTLSYRGRWPDHAAQFTTPIGRRLRIIFGLILATSLWPYFALSICRKPSFLIRDEHNRDVGRLPTSDRNVANEFISKFHTGAVIICNERQLLACYLMTLLGAVGALLILNAAVDQLEISFR